jgi:hypothetical protein
MQIVTPCRSASGMSAVRPRAQISSPSWSSCPSRLPEKQMMFGTPAAAANGMACW